MIAPMLATLAEAPLVDATLVYEPKYDGMRAIAEVGAGGRSVRLWSRLGNDKSAQFPEVIHALAAWAARRPGPVTLDGEIVALDSEGRPAGFQQLQARIHVKGRPVSSGPTAFMLFDVLRIGERDLRSQPLTARRASLESLFAKSRSPLLRVGEQVAGDGCALYARALESGWEGIIAKHAASKYRSGKRSPDWRKLKIIKEQEFVIAGWTEPRESRAHFGALLLGVHQGDALVYAGHVGTGFDEKGLTLLTTRLAPLETRTCPFTVKPTSNERPHWVRPELVAQIKFSEWTADNHLRHPVFVGLRDDTPAPGVVREHTARLHGSATRRLASPATGGRPHTMDVPARPRPQKPASADAAGIVALIDQLSALEDGHRDGVVELPGGETLPVTNLHKVFWPTLKLTKGDLFRYYAQVSPFILPVLADRPLVMKRFPNGVEGKAFYQHRAEHPPDGVRVEPVAAAGGVPQLIGGTLKTLLYSCQLASISQDPWFSRLSSPGAPDQVALDLDPADDVPFERVLDVARWIRDELHELGVFALPKTSGATGLHIFIPLAPGTPYEAGLIFCQLIATIVAEKHPKVATIERSVRARGPRVYVDYLQNIEGKTLASAYSARASEYAGASTPITWKEVDRGVRREDFTIVTVPARLKKVGDLWEGIRTAPGADLHKIANA